VGVSTSATSRSSIQGACEATAASSRSAIT
jgi:hypothetical protein